MEEWTSYRESIKMVVNNNVVKFFYQPSHNSFIVMSTPFIEYFKSNYIKTTIEETNYSVMKINMN